MEMNHLSHTESERDWRLLISRPGLFLIPAWPVSLWLSLTAVLCSCSLMVSFTLTAVTRNSFYRRQEPSSAVCTAGPHLAGLVSVCTTVREWWPGDEWREPGLHNSWSDGCGNITTPSLDPLHFSLLTDMETHVTVNTRPPGLLLVRARVPCVQCPRCWVWPRVRVNNGPGPWVELLSHADAGVSAVTVFCIPGWAHNVQPCLNMLGTCVMPVKLCGIFWQLLTHSQPQLHFSPVLSLLVLALFVSGWCHQSCHVETTCQFLCWQNRIKVLFSYLS